MEEYEPARALARGGAAADQGDWPLPRETSCLSLCWAVLDLVITHSNGVTFTDLDRQAIDGLSCERAERTTGEEVIAA